nr:hypothetical protein [Chlamydiota bacterium]
MYLGPVKEIEIISTQLDHLKESSDSEKLVGQFIDSVSDFSEKLSLKDIDSESLSELYEKVHVLDGKI